jgi:hypothetical protein
MDHIVSAASQLSAQLDLERVTREVADQELHDWSAVVDANAAFIEWPGPSPSSVVCFVGAGTPNLPALELEVTSVNRLEPVTET